MKSTSMRSISWWRIGFAILPGIWLMLQYRRAYTSGFWFELGTLVITVLVFLGLVVTSLLVERRLAPWCLPAVGSLLWKMSRTSEYLSFARRLGTIAPLDKWYDWWDRLLAIPPMLALWALARWLFIISGGILITYWTVRWLKKQKSRLVWGLLILLAIVTLTLDRWTWPFLLVYLGIVILTLLSLIAPIAVGQILVERDGLTAGLLVVAWEPFLIYMLFKPDAIFYKLLPRMYDVPNTAGQELALLLLSCLPLVCFFIVTPIGLLATRSAKAQLGWLVVPSFLTLVSMALIKGFALEGTEFEYSPMGWVELGLHVIQLWIPLVLTGIIYSDPKKTNGEDVETKPGLVLHQTPG